MGTDLPTRAPARHWSSRPYVTETDFQQMQVLLMAGRAQSDDWHYTHIGELAFAFLMVACHLDPRDHIRLWQDGDDALVGYAILGEGPSLDWQVLPDYEWSGIEDEALAWADARLAELRARDAAQWSGGLAAGARQDNGRRRFFLGQHGFRYSGEFAEVNMLRALDPPVPSPVVPAGWQVRALAGPDEIPLRAAAHRAVWLPWSDGEVSDADYARMMALPGYERDLDVVAVAPDGLIASTVVGWLDPVNRVGCFGQVGALPAYRRRGLTRAAMLECLRRMQAHGMARACVSTGVSNIPAIRLYQSVGFETVNIYLDYVRPG